MRRDIRAFVAVMPGLVPGIHDLDKTWMAGTSPAMTNERLALKPIRR
jgi:hypothetical protein